jgi:hypothetical protein
MPRNELCPRSGLHGSPKPSSGKMQRYRIYCRCQYLCQKKQAKAAERMKINSKVGLLVLPVAFLSTFAFAAIAQQPILGVMEENPGVYAGEPNSYGVRICFKKNRDDWKAYPSDCQNQSCLKKVPAEYPRLIQWTISFDGKLVGQLTGETPDEFLFYSRVGLQKIISTGVIPSIGKPSIEFAGFLDQPVHRPLVANSRPYFRDPDLWKPVQAPLGEFGVLRQQFRKKYPKLCRSNEQDESKLESLPYRDEDVRVAKAYQSRDGWIIARLHVKAAIDCSDTESGFEMDDSWFVVDPKHSASYLASGIWLVDAGDYDGDGKSELLFSLSQYNRGGYMLYYDQFRKHVAFEYSYH